MMNDLRTLSEVFPHVGNPWPRDGSGEKTVAGADAKIESLKWSGAVIPGEVVVSEPISTTKRA